ncbi:signaling peptide TAXIMIN 2 [Telopea speciosissima]|uniref:signaling peptide TAXIMIN 2 n=1 Tax=Telopea speciosissima TaxID=54955 RepID=UPI001CC4C500|nr:signaling peptide TAXIMIN 2 [Telopea speciosissima]
MGECRPLGFLLGLPFALIALVLSLVGIVVWIIGSVLSCLCPCCICCAGIANLAMDTVKLPVKVMRCFTDQIPC